MRKPKLSLDINAANAYNEISFWEHSSLVPDAPTDKRETRPFATNCSSILTLRPHSSSSCVNTYSGEPGNVSTDRHNQRIYAIIPLTHHSMDSCIASSSRYSSQSSGSSTSQSTIKNETRFPNGTGATVRQSKKELKALEKKGRSLREVDEMNVR